MAEQNTGATWAEREAVGWREEEGHVIPPGSTLAIVKRGLEINARMSKAAGFGAARRDRTEEV